MSGYREQTLRDTHFFIPSPRTRECLSHKYKPRYVDKNRMLAVMNNLTTNATVVIEGWRTEGISACEHAEIPIYSPPRRRITSGHN